MKNKETPIYLDYASTTPIDKRVAEKMLEYMTTDGMYGNPASRSLVMDGMQMKQSQ